MAMSDPAIIVESISKAYRLGVIGRNTLQDEVRFWWHKARGRDPRQYMSKVNAIGKDQSQTHGSGSIFWALRDISFEVPEGKVVGIIGRNGAGKSTLLKILTQITEPTSGQAILNGRVSSLLEVGTGFHPELTGRENIYLNGSILGMKRYEIAKKFDEIVEFAEMRQFIDTPVKRYSSGMYVRLAFAVAAHLEPEIMLVDEVLAVGDAEFQKKCLGKMKEVSRHGRTVLFVSHNMMAIRNLCERTILIDQGRIVMDSDSEHAIAKYLDRNLIEGAVANADEIEQRTEGVLNKSNRYVCVQQISLLDEIGVAKKIFDSDEEVIVSIHFECLQSVRDLHIRVYIVDENNRPIVGNQTSDDLAVSPKMIRLESGRYQTLCTFPKYFFGGKLLYLTVHVQLPKIEHLVIEKILEFEVIFRGFNKNEQVARGGSKVYVWPELKWTMDSLQE